METPSRFALPGTDPDYEHDNFRQDRLKLYEPISAGANYQQALKYMAEVIAGVLNGPFDEEDTYAETGDDGSEADQQDTNLEYGIATTNGDETMRQFVRLEADEAARSRGIVRTVTIGKECSSGDELHFARYLKIVEAETGIGYVGASQAHYYHGQDIFRGISFEDDGDGITQFDLDYFEKVVSYIHIHKQAIDGASGS